ncbi:MAG: TetR/AcrR family transcriptional regulator [Deltaproteobacteria bacterium]|nr:TetR/AcrR family transcriptional regulator [Deltaproteobacteria bacterium]MCB9489660.1 TetR/AcrR family transcriptional regulator [Deltaproteobacteria bacterium]
MARPRKNSLEEATTSRVLRAAENAFGQHGFAAARLEDIAKEVGITRPSLLYHFSSKENLYHQVVKRAFDQLRDVVLQAMVVERTYAHQLDAVVRDMLKFADQRPFLLHLVLRELVDPTEPGKKLAQEELLPLIDLIESLVIRNGGDMVPKNVPLRSAIMSLIVSYLVRVASGDVGRALWGEKDHTQELARYLLLKKSGA